MFKVGDMVRVKSNANISNSGKLLRRKIGQIISCHISEDGRNGYVVLDIEKTVRSMGPGGIWIEEIELVSEYKKVIKQYGIVKFMQKTT